MSCGEVPDEQVAASIEFTSQTNNHTSINLSPDSVSVNNNMKTFQSSEINEMITQSNLT